MIIAVNQLRKGYNDSKYQKYLAEISVPLQLEQWPTLCNPPPQASLGTPLSLQHSQKRAYERLSAQQLGIALLLFTRTALKLSHSCVQSPRPLFSRVQSIQVSTSCIQLTRKLQQLFIKVVVTAYSTIEGII